MLTSSIRTDMMTSQKVNFEWVKRLMTSYKWESCIWQLAQPPRLCVTFASLNNSVLWNITAWSNFSDDAYRSLWWQITYRWERGHQYTPSSSSSSFCPTFSLISQMYEAHMSCLVIRLEWLYKGLTCIRADCFLVWHCLLVNTCFVNTRIIIQALSFPNLFIVYFPPLVRHSMS